MKENKLTKISIGEQLKKLRLHAGLSQTEMAAGVISESYYSKVERGVHGIDADVLIDLLAKHYFGVIEFFNNLVNQNSNQNPDFELINEITFAQNRKDVMALDKIAAKIEKMEEVSETVKIRLARSYAWTYHSNDMVSDEIKQAVKQHLGKGDWGRSNYYYLGSTVILLDISDAYQFVDQAFHSWERDPKNDTFSLQSTGLIAVNFLNCCYHRDARPEYYQRAINFLKKLPVEPAIGLNKILGRYYEALFTNDKQTMDIVIELLKDTGYYSIIQDTVD